MPTCAVFNCRSYNRKTKDTDIKYFRFPKNKELESRWINACHRKDRFNVSNARICSLHFNAGQFEISLKHKLLNVKPKNARYLKPDAVPNENLPNSKNRDEQRFKRDWTEARIQKADRKDAIEAILKDSESNTIPNCIDCSTNSDVDEVLASNEVAKISSNSKVERLEKTIVLLKKRIEQLKYENRKLKSRRKKT